LAPEALIAMITWQLAIDGRNIEHPANDTGAGGNANDLHDTASSSWSLCSPA
jgi:hypothetical protein